MNEEEQAKFRLLLLDIDKRTEEVRQMKAYEFWRLFFAGLTAVAASSAVLGGGIVWSLVHAGVFKP